MILSIIEGKSEMRRYKFENLLIAFLINKQQYCLSIVDGKKWDEEVEVEILLMTILISKQQSYLSVIDEKKWDEEVEVENLLIAMLIIKQRKKFSSQNLPECAFYNKNLPECAFSQKFILTACYASMRQKGNLMKSRELVQMLSLACAIYHEVRHMQESKS